ncbi:MAG: T9SS type A sorting domain-containing protein, partial [Bacteroidetes bacterium]|nr:T9SS type A sorting domain-containing protein [Bacteroidota bacterium]
ESDMALKLINQYLDTASNPSVYDFSAENSISLCLWLKIDQTIVDWTGVLNNWADFGIGGYYLGITPNQEIRWNINADPPIDGPSVPTNTWMHIAATYDGNTAFLYIDGNLAAQRVFGTNMLSSVYPFTVGTQANNTNNILPGVLDDVLIYNRAVSQSEIMDIMTVLSIEDMEAFGQAVSLSPNPVSSTLKMSYDHHLGTLTRYELRDSKGMLVDQRAINGVQWDIDFSTLAAGFYVVQLHTADGQTLHKKIIKK